MRIHIDMSELSLKATLLASFFRDETVVHCLHTAVYKTMVPEAIKNIRTQRLRYRGALVRSIRVEKDTAKSSFLGKKGRSVTFGSFGLKYAAAIEQGGRPHTPPLDPIYEWVKEKIRPKDTYAFTMAVIRTIEKQGTQKYPYVLPAVHTQKDAMARARGKSE